MTITLPTKPTGEQYEDLLAASFMVLGYFVEKRLVLRSRDDEVLELDLVVTPTGTNYAKKILVEAKSGSWGLSDLFKVYGWRKYLGIPTALLVHQGPKRSVFDRIGKKTKVACGRLTVGKNDVDDVHNYCCNGLSEKLFNRMSGIVWYSQIAERLACIEFTRRCKSEQDAAFALARDYEKATKASFFKKDSLSRVNQLYTAYQNGPNVTGELVRLQANRKNLSEKAMWNIVNDTHDDLWIQYVMLVEHRARAAVVKNALDYALGVGPKPKSRKIGRIKIDWGRVLENSLPASFKEGVEKLKQHSYGRSIPYLFQIFVELFGGYYVKGSKDMDLMSGLSGIPSDQIEECLNLYDTFFPMDKGWFFQMKGGLVCMKMVPGFIKGAGSFFRHGIIDFKEYDEYCPGKGFLLSKWHNALYTALANELKVAVKAS